MRRWVVIGLVAAVIGGGITALVLKPWESPVEYHVRGYKEAQRRLAGRMTFLERVVGELTPRRGGRDMRAVEEHEHALTRLGYLEERVFVASNAPLPNFIHAIHFATRKRDTNFEFLHVALSGTNAIKVVMRKGLMPTHEEVLKELELVAQKYK